MRSSNVASNGTSVRRSMIPPSSSSVRMAVAASIAASAWRMCSIGRIGRSLLCIVARGRVCMRAKVRSGARNVELALMAVPLSGERDEAAREVERIALQAA